jgi:hypothetical protein
MEKEVCSRQALQAVWEKDPQYLQAETLQWLPARHYSKLQELWPPKDDPLEKKKRRQQVCNEKSTVCRRYYYWQWKYLHMMLDMYTEKDERLAASSSQGQNCR